MEYSRSCKGIWVPIEIWSNKELSMIEQHLFSEIDSLDGKRGCWASNDYFAEFMGCSEKTISRSLKTLLDKNYVSQYYKNGKRILKSNLKYVIVQPEFDVKTIDPYDETYCTDEETKSPLTEDKTSTNYNNNINKNINKKNKQKKPSITDLNIVIAELTLPDDIKDLLRSFIKNTSYRYNTTDELKERLDKLFKTCNNDNAIIYKVVKQALDKDWKDFYEESYADKFANAITTEQRTFLPVYNHPGLTQTKHLKLSQSEVIDLALDKRCWPKNGKYAKMDFSDIKTNPEKEEIIRHTLQLMFGEIDLELTKYINANLTPTCEGKQVVYNWLTKNPGKPEYYKKGFAWWLKD